MSPEGETVYDPTEQLEQESHGNDRAWYAGIALLLLILAIVIGITLYVISSSHAQKTTTLPSSASSSRTTTARSTSTTSSTTSASTSSSTTINCVTQPGLCVGGTSSIPTSTTSTTSVSTTSMSTTSTSTTSTSTTMILGEPKLEASNTPMIGVGQYEAFTANLPPLMQGVTPYSYNYQIINSITKELLGNQLYIGVSSATDVFAWQVPNGDAGNAIIVNVTITDSESPANTVNSIYTPPIEIMAQQQTTLTTTSSTTTSSSTTSSSSTTTSTTTASSTTIMSENASYYVATDGNDMWSGNIPSPNAAHTNGPFASISRAQQAVRQLKQNQQNRNTPIIVMVEGGTYYLNSTLEFTSADSGNQNMQIIYESYPGQNATISGGKKVTGWTQLSGNEWEASMKGYQYFEQLWVNGVRKYRPSTSSGYLYMAGPVYVSSYQPGCQIQVSNGSYECTNQFRFKSGDISSGYYNLSDVEVLTFVCWKMDRMRIKSVNTATDIVYFTGDATNQTSQSCNGYSTGDRYLVENVKSDLTQTGQWYLDQPNDQLLYMASPGENPNDENVIVPQLNQILVADNLQYVTFENLTFSYSNWVTPAQGWQSSEAEALGLANPMNASLNFTNSSYIIMNHDIISHMGGYGIKFVGTAAQPFTPTTQHPYNDELINSEITDMGGGGMMIGTNPKGDDTNSNVAQYVLVQNNVFSGVGRIQPPAQAIFVMDAHNNMLDHNLIYDSYSADAVTMGTNTGGGPTQLAHNNVFEYNLAYDLNQGVEEDGGGIHITSANETGNKILDNVIHNVVAWEGNVSENSSGYGGWGIYIDDSTSNLQVEDNLVYNVSEACISIGQGYNDTINNNIFAYCGNGVVAKQSANPTQLSFTFEHNIAYYDTLALITHPDNYNIPGVFQESNEWDCALNGDTTPCSDVFNFEDNLYWYTNGNPVFITDNPKEFYTLAQWQKIGEDSGSIIANPDFTNVNDYDFNFASSANYSQIGFVPFQISAAGRYDNATLNPPPVPAAFPTLKYNPFNKF